MPDPVSHDASLSSVALFPLPNVVLFPGAVLPLHIFEQRYKTMTADAIAADRPIAMALLRPGWEKNYYGRAEIEPVVCMGSIVSHEKLADGKYNLLLQGQLRARVAQELNAQVAAGGQAYRIARLEPMPQTDVLESDLEPQRQRLLSLFSSGEYAATVLAGQFRKLLDQRLLPAPAVADLIAFNYFEDVNLKQLLLGECDVARRISRTIAELEALRPHVGVARRNSGLGKPSVN